MPALPPPQPAVSVVEFARSVGVNVPIYSSSASEIQVFIKGLNYLGTPRVRAALGGSQMFSALDQVYAGTHIKWDPFLAVGWGFNYGTALTWIKGHLSEIETLENANEVDNWPVNGDPSLQASVAQQKQFWSSVQSLGVNVITTSLGNPVNANKLMPTVGTSNLANSHDYPPTGADLAQWIPQWTQKSDTWAPNQFTIQTEAGFSTPPSTVGVSLQAQAKLTMNLLFQSYKQGINRTYIFEITDGPGNSSVRDSNFGLLHYDGSPKPSGTAVHNLLTWLAPTGDDTLTPPPATGSLSYSVSGLQHGYDMLLQRPDGTFILAVWQDVTIPGISGDVSAPTQTAQIDLGSSTNATIFDPVSGSTTTQTGSSLKVPVGGNVVLVQLGGTPPATTAEIAAGAPQVPSVGPTGPTGPAVGGIATGGTATGGTATGSTTAHGATGSATRPGVSGGPTTATTTPSSAGSTGASSDSDNDDDSGRYGSNGTSTVSTDGSVGGAGYSGGATGATGAGKQASGQAPAPIGPVSTSGTVPTSAPATQVGGQTVAGNSTMDPVVALVLADLEVLSMSNGPYAAAARTALAALEPLVFQTNGSQPGSVATSEAPTTGAGVAASVGTNVAAPAGQDVVPSSDQPGLTVTKSSGATGAAISISGSVSTPTGQTGESASTAGGTVSAGGSQQQQSAPGAVYNPSWNNLR